MSFDCAGGVDCGRQVAVSGSGIPAFQVTLLRGPFRVRLHLESLPFPRLQSRLNVLRARAIEIEYPTQWSYGM